MTQTMLLLAVLSIAPSACLVQAESTSATSPNDRVRIEFSLEDGQDGKNIPHVRILFDDQEIIERSRLGFEFGDGTRIGGPCEIIKLMSRTIAEDYEQFPGKRRVLAARASELVIRLRESIEPKREWDLHLRAYDDGAAVRYSFPLQDGWQELSLAQELTEFKVSAQSKAFALPLNGYTTSYEKRYELMPVGQLPENWLLGLPFLIASTGGNWVAITEANINEFAGMYLAHRGDGVLQARLSPLPGVNNIAVRAALPHVSPWRVVLLGDHPGRLIEADLILHLNEPCAIEDTSWIRPGKTTFPWWNGYFEENVPFKPGLNTATVKHYIDFCAEAGIPYHSLDGVGNSAWYGGPIVPYQGADPTTAVAEIDLPEVLEYARSKGIRLRLWMHWKAAAEHMERAFPKFQQWGIEGVMLDFMDRDDQEMNQFVRRAVKLAAQNHLTITLHGCPKPFGLERTYPNLLTHEGVLNLEYDKWDQQGVSPTHEVTVPFTRMLAGPLDFHQGSFRTVPAESFAPRIAAPLVIGTPARTLASYVVYQNHLSMVADYPSAYRGHPGLKLLAAIPSTWDETIVLDASVGEYILIARRSKSDWYVGAMTDGSERDLEVPLKFLPEGEFRARIASDDATAEYGLRLQEASVNLDTRLQLHLTAAGGALIELIPKR